MINNQRGSAVVMGVAVMLFLAIASAGLLPWVTTQLKLAPMGKDILEAEYAAEAGAKRAVVEFTSATPNWTWLGLEKPLNNDVTTKKYNVIIYQSDDATKTPVGPVLTANNTYTIQSTGTVGSAVKIVTVKINVTGSGGGAGTGNDVFSKYSFFSNGDVEISNTPIIKGDIGSNANIQIHTADPIINGIAYTPAPPKNWQTAWNKNAVTGGYNQVSTAGTLDVASLIPAMPSFTKPSTNLPNPGGSTITLNQNAYYYNGDYSTGKTLRSTSGQLLLYIDGDLTLSYSSGTSAAIIGNDVTLYVKGNFQMDNYSSIQATNLKIYATGTITLTNNAKINAESLLIQTTSTSSSSITFGSDSSINKGSTTAINKIYSNGGLQFTNQFQMGGKAGLVAIMGAFNLNSTTVAPQTVFVSNSGTSQVTNQVKIGGIYTNGSLNINSSPTIDFGPNKSAILQALGLTGGTGIVTIQPGSWSVK